VAQQVKQIGKAMDPKHAKAPKNKEKQNSSHK